MDLTNLTLSNSADSLTGNLTVLSGALEAAKQSLGLQDHYTIYLRNYCGWNGNDQYSNCTSPASYFWFNPIKVWGLNSTGVPVSDYLPDSLTAGLDTYHAASKAMFVFYCAALAATCFTLVVGISAIFSRWGSFATTFFAGAATLANLGATILATAIFIILRTALNHTFEKDYGISSTLGNRGLVVAWLSCAFSVSAGFFWLLSVCCCSGRSPYHKDAYGGGAGRGRTRAEKTPYTYERVGSPYMGPRESNVPLTTFNQSSGPNHAPHGGAYEPFRPQHV
jgi:SUR7/PalI family